jgi:2-isopropylmalate synthase
MRKAELAELIFDWNGESAAPKLRKVEIDDETLRDGLQSPSVAHPSIDVKRSCLRHMVALGIQRIDVGLPMSPQISDIRELLRVIDEEQLPILPGLAVRTDPADLEPVAKLRDEFPRLPIRANAFLGLSRIRRLSEDWSEEKQENLARTALHWARDHGIPVMFVTEDTTRSHPEDIRRLYGMAIELGVKEICIADTVGHVLPWGARAIVRFMRDYLTEIGATDVLVNWHGHRDRGFSLANTIAAMEAGADVVHATVLGIGERCGNTPLDQLLVNLKLLGLWDAPLDHLADYVREVSAATHIDVPVNYPVFGQDAFRTATGVHASAIIKALRQFGPEVADSVYAGVPAWLVGRRQQIDVGRLSGKANARWWLETHEREPTDDAIQRILRRAAKSWRVLTDAEIEDALRND